MQAGKLKNNLQTIIAKTVLALFSLRQGLMNQRITFVPTGHHNTLPGFQCWQFSDARESLTHNPVQFIIIANDNLDFLLTTRQNKWVGRESSFHMTRGGGGGMKILKLEA